MQGLAVRRMTRPAISVLVASVFAGACFPRIVAPPVPPPDPGTLREMIEAGAPRAEGLRITVDTARGAVVVLAGPFVIPPSPSHDSPHSHMAGEDGAHVVTRLRFDWPVGGWVRGYELRLFDTSGARIDPSLAHHFLLINFDRRQFVHPTVEKLVGVGRETGDVQLPVTMGVPLERGRRLGMYAAWHNGGPEEVTVFLRLVLRWTPADGSREPTSVMPVNLDVHHDPGGSSAYDLPPGRSSRSFEFEAPVSGRLLVVSGHLHDYGLEVRLEEAATGREVINVRGILDEEGRILGVEQKKWVGFLGRGVHLEAGRWYRLVGEYDNPEPDTLRAGAMAQMVAVFAPHDGKAWPSLDTGHPQYRADVEGWELHLTSREFMRLRTDDAGP